MLVDHMGAIFFPELVFVRIIGRLSFPLFAYLIAVGYLHTRNVGKYMARILIFFLISQPIYFFVIPLRDLNIFATLFMGLVALLILDKVRNKILGFSLIILIGIIAEAIEVNYGFYGIFTILLFKIFDKDKKFWLLLITQGVLTLISIYYAYGLYLLGRASFGIFDCLQIYALGALIIIGFYNGRRGPSFKYGFYAFYPVHLFILGLIKYFIR